MREESLKVPEPPVVHLPVEVPPQTAPASVTFGLLAQTVWSVPALTYIPGLIVTIIASLTAVHNPLPVVVRVKVTLPAAVSASLGEYVAPRFVEAGAKEPDPDVVQFPPVATVTEPDSVTFGAFAH